MGLALRETFAHRAQPLLAIKDRYRNATTRRQAPPSRRIRRRTHIGPAVRGVGRQAQAGEPTNLARTASSCLGPRCVLAFYLDRRLPVPTACPLRTRDWRPGAT
ncbi:UNVERIFIED_CONTAM: hypothetical protein Sangu_1615300 [Sesamum angustifolium]|uniref:Uncharacterized protein n=1 Tax=Sesamum angustifolium TaxID=2727405 RepID=A0AAW2MJY7_9LAMI